MSSLPRSMHAAAIPPVPVHGTSETPLSPNATLTRALLAGFTRDFRAAMVGDRPCGDWGIGPAPSVVWHQAWAEEA